MTVLTADHKSQTLRLRASAELSIDRKCPPEIPELGRLYISLSSKFFLFNVLINQKKHQQSLSSTNWVLALAPCSREYKDNTNLRPNLVSCLKQRTA